MVGVLSDTIAETQAAEVDRMSAREEKSRSFVLTNRQGRIVITALAALIAQTGYLFYSYELARADTQRALDQQVFTLARTAAVVHAMGLEARAAAEERGCGPDLLDFLWRTRDPRADELEGWQSADELFPGLFLPDPADRPRLPPKDAAG